MSDAAIENWWASMHVALVELVHDPQAQKIAGTLAVFSFILYLLIKET
jgi:hypothetical protein